MKKITVPITQFIDITYKLDNILIKINTEKLVK